MANDLLTRRVTVAVFWFAALSASVYAFVFEPGKSGFFPACMFRTITGLACPGCGSTRALHQLLHGHVGKAFALNPLLVIALPILMYVLVRHTAWAISGAEPVRNRLPAPVIYAMFYLLLSFWVIRNTSFYPFVS
ncbi:MAG TPA: DUF2752 domain-containing protein [Pyrinomonadaceae bacterium]|nr:DUF2752 domain-containing protein [Pyrinomonadaceae bacterium]